MTGFFEPACSSRILCVDDIAAINDAGKNRYGADHFTVSMKGGQPSCSLVQSEVDRLMMRPAQLIPAEPGSSRVWFDMDPQSGEIWEGSEPVIAWALCLDGQIRPVTPDGVNAGQGIYDPVYVEMPSGGIFGGPEHDPMSFKNLDEMRKHERARLEMERIAKLDRAKS